MALVDDDEIEKITGVVPIEAWLVGVASDALIDGEIHLAAFDRHPLDLVARFSKRRKHFCLRLIHADVAIREIQDSRSPMLPALFHREFQSFQQI